MQSWCLDQEDLLEEGMATHSSILTWEIPWREDPERLVCRVTKSHMLLSTHTPKIFQNNATKMPFCKGYGFLPVIFVWLFFFPLEVSDIQESVAEFIQNCIPMQLCHRSKTQKIYCNPEGFLCSFSIYNCLRNSISLSSITIVSSCLWLYFI